MRRSTKKRLIPLALALALAMVGAALAVPSITVHVKGVGAGGPTRIENPIQQADVSWNLDTTTDPDVISGIHVDLTIDSTVATFSGKVYIKFLDNSDNLVYIYSKNIDNTQVTSGHITFDIDKLYTNANDADNGGTPAIDFTAGTVKLEDLAHFYKVAVVYVES